MCGLAFASGAQSKDWVLESLTSMAHRGPDATHCVQVLSDRPKAWLGHNRLSIVDIDSGTQPVSSGGKVTAFNGEIFNYRDFGFEGEAKFLHTLLSSNTKHPESYLLGYYGILHVNPSQKTLTVMRDPVGVIPLWFEVSKDRLRVSSERHVLSKGRRFLPGTVSIFNLLDPTNFVQRQRTILATRNREFQPEIALSFLTEACRKVASHSDVGFDLALSGGLDSTLLCTVLASLGLHPESTYTATFFSEETDEVRMARATAHRLGLRHEVVCITKDMAEAVRDTYRMHIGKMNPIRFSAFLRHYYIAQRAKTKVILCGEGADELDCGYPSHASAPDAIRFNRKRQQIFCSQSDMTLNRVNSAGMLHSREYRVPYLYEPLVEYMMSCASSPGKKNLKKVASLIGLSEGQYMPTKYSVEEVRGRSW